jgi:hypothetical protein
MNAESKAHHQSFATKAIHVGSVSALLLCSRWIRLRSLVFSASHFVLHALFL